MWGFLIGCGVAWLGIVVLNQFTRSVAGGVSDGRLAPCPATPNCVSSQADDAGQLVEPLRLAPASADELRARLKAALARMPRARVVREEGNYLHVEHRTAGLRFVDDMELLIEPASGVVHVRSASRVGVSDLGANRRRVEALRAVLAK